MTTQIDSAAAVDRFLAGVRDARIPTCGAFTPDVVLDATVPNWRFTTRGAEAVVAELSHWFADAGTFEDLERAPLPGGELVEFTLTWLEDGVAHACHQVHVLQLADGLIAADRAWCGGRWSAPLLAEMAHAGR